MPKTTGPYVKRQRQQVIEVIEQAEQNHWLLGAEVQLSERISTQVCVELLAHGLVIMGAGQNRYHICATSNANVKEYLKKAKAEI